MPWNLRNWLSSSEKWSSPVSASVCGIVPARVGLFSFNKTCLGGKRAGQCVNLERALFVGDAMGGHFVTGHVDGTGTVREVRAIGVAWGFGSVDELERAGAHAIAHAPHELVALLE